MAMSAKHGRMEVGGCGSVEGSLSAKNIRETEIANKSVMEVVEMVSGEDKAG